MACLVGKGLPEAMQEELLRGRDPPLDVWWWMSWCMSMVDVCHGYLWWMSWMFQWMSVLKRIIAGPIPATAKVRSALANLEFRWYSGAFV